MNFSILSDCHKKWLDILVIGKTIERDGRKYYIVDMTLSDEAKLYIIEPYDKREPINRKGIRNHRRILKEREGKSCSFYFTDDYVDNVQCHINNVTLIFPYDALKARSGNRNTSTSFSHYLFINLFTHYNCRAVYETRTYGSMGGARKNILPLPYFHGYFTIRNRKEAMRQQW